MHAGKIRLFELALQDIFQKLVDERDEARLWARKFYREAQEWKQYHREDTDILNRFIDDAERWSATWKRAAKKWRVQELERDVDWKNLAVIMEVAIHDADAEQDALQKRVAELEHQLNEWRKVGELIDKLYAND